MVHSSRLSSSLLKLAHSPFHSFTLISRFPIGIRISLSLSPPDLITQFTLMIPTVKKQAGWHWTDRCCQWEKQQKTLYFDYIWLIFNVTKEIFPSSFRPECDDNMIYDTCTYSWSNKIFFKKQENIFQNYNRNWSHSFIFTKPFFMQ